MTNGNGISASLRQNRALSNNCPRSCPQALTIKAEPVCGSDGLIYANICEMKKKTCPRNGAKIVKVSSNMNAKCDSSHLIDMSLEIKLKKSYWHLATLIPTYQILDYSRESLLS